MRSLACTTKERIEYRQADGLNFKFVLPGMAQNRAHNAA
jgi:hypothetical protein